MRRWRSWDICTAVVYVLRDRDAKFCAEFRQILAAEGVKCLRLPPRSPNLNAFAERWVRSVKEECLSKLILFAEASLRRALTQFQEHYHRERNHQGKGKRSVIPPWRGPAEEPGTIDRVQRAPRRSSQVLPSPGRMSFLTLRFLGRLFMPTHTTRFGLLARLSEEVLHEAVLVIDNHEARVLRSV
jgi:hypothetical protein